MSVLSGATASGRLMYVGILGTTSSTLYTAPSFTSNVTSTTAGTSASGSAVGSATAYIKEIAICNTTSNPVVVTIWVNSQALLNALTINSNDTKILSGLNTMLCSGAIISGNAGTASAITVQISGTEIQ